MSISSSLLHEVLIFRPAVFSKSSALDWRPYRRERRHQNKSPGRAGCGGNGRGISGLVLENPYFDRHRQLAGHANPSD